MIARNTGPVVAHLDGRLSALGLRTPWSRDVLLAVALAVGSVVVLVPLLGPIAAGLGVPFAPAEIIAVTVLVVVQCLFLCLRRVRPITCLVLVAVVQLALVAVLPDQTTVRLLAPIVAAYSAGTRLPPRRLVGAVGLVVGMEVLGSPVVRALVTPTVRTDVLGLPVTAPGPGFGEWLLGGVSVVLVYGAAALAGQMVATRRAYVTLLEEQAVAALRAQEAQAARAVDAERTRMARELHDIAAHHLTGLVVQAGAAERLLERDPAAAREATRAVRAQGKAALTNLRLVVGVLRERDGDGSPPSERGAVADGPVPGLGMLDDLLLTARTLGDDVEVAVTGQPFELAPVADVTAYRVLQEALTNARQHAPGQPVRVCLTYRAGSVQVEVTNPLVRGSGPAAGTERGGYGLLGMRERAELARAQLDVGPTENNPTENKQWRVRLTLRHVGENQP